MDLADAGFRICTGASPGGGPIGGFPYIKAGRLGASHSQWHLCSVDEPVGAATKLLVDKLRP